MLLSVALVPGTASAQSQSQPGTAAPKAGAAKGGDPVFAKLDTNHDGKISLAEWNAARKRDFQRLDRNRDGKLDEAELSAAGPDPKQVRADISARIKGDDRNHDGKLTRDEYIKANVERLMKLDRNGDGAISTADAGPGGPPPGLAEFIKQGDTNHDGKLTRDELEAGAGANFDRSDTNHDGILSEAEAEQAVNAQRRTMAAARLKAMGAGSDGKLTLAAYVAEEDKLFKQLDRNGDGALTPDEVRPPRGAQGSPAK